MSIIQEAKISNDQIRKKILTSRGIPVVELTNGNKTRCAAEDLDLPR